MITTAFDRLVFQTRQQIGQWQLRVTFMFGMLERDRDRALYEQLLVEVRVMQQTVRDERANLMQKLQSEPQEGAFRSSRQSQSTLQVALDNTLLRIAEAEAALQRRIALLELAPPKTRRRRQARLGSASPLSF
ncbi:MAG: hypothetical protein JWR75_224 [Devosia sp.]|nr:hypothetical protein [Devosia sp.]